MPRLLRGKKTQLKIFTENFTKVPNIILHADGLAPIEKLILIELQSFSSRPTYVVAYTRMGKDLKLDKSNFIDRWKGLIEKGYIYVTTDGCYSINYDLLTGGQNLPNSEVSKTYQPTNIDSQNPPTIGGYHPPTQVATTHLNGSQNLPIEEESKDKEKEIKNKEEEKPILEFSSTDQFLKMLPDKFKNHILLVEDKKKCIYDFLKNGNISIDETYFLVQIKIENWIDSINKRQSKEPINKASTDLITKEKNDSSINSNKEVINNSIDSISFALVQSKVSGASDAPSINKIDLGAPIGAVTSAPAFDERLLQRVNYVVSELLRKEYIEPHKNISTADLVKGLTLNSTESEIRRHISTYYQNHQPESAEYDNLPF